MNITSLEQSKKLKEWGAPQDTSHYWFDVLSDDGKEKGHYVLREADWKYDAGEFGGDKAIAAYDLESLILWLGKDFDSVFKIPDVYCAQGINQHYKYDDTPLEAVYGLARSIHQPNELGKLDK